MTTILHERRCRSRAIAGSRVAVVGYGNQGRSWALNLRDSGLDTVVCVRADETRARAAADGFTPVELDASSEADIVCLLVPDDIIPTIPLAPRGRRPRRGGERLHAGVRSARSRTATWAWWRPRMLGPEVRSCYEEGVGFITAFGVHRDATGRARKRTLGRRSSDRRAPTRRDRDDADARGGARPRGRASARARAAARQPVVRAGDARTRHPARSDPVRAVPLR